MNLNVIYVQRIAVYSVNLIYPFVRIISEHYKTVRFK